MKVSKRYQEATLQDDDLHSPSPIRVRDTFTGAERTSYQEQEPVENDAQRLAMKKGDMPPPVPERALNPRIRQGLHRFHCVRIT